MGDIVRDSDFTLRQLPAPQIRKDPVTGRWTLVATDRALRPLDEPDVPELCPFCEGHERETPPELSALREPDTLPNGPGWRVRVIPNRFPAVRLWADGPIHTEGLFEDLAGIGSHEVIIDCPHHQVSFGALPIEAIREVIEIWRERIVAHDADLRLKYVQIFKNKGIEAGASLGHSHSQLIALPLVPSAIQEEIDRGRSYFDHERRCLFCDLIERERTAGARMVAENEHFAVVCAYAARWPFETWVLPKRHGSHFERSTDAELGGLANTLGGLLQRLDAGLKQPPYNLVLHTASLHTEALPHYHWHMELLPRLTQPAGFEWGTGWHINPVPPEQAAAFLREVKIE
jgi:UDPglucose--hexose-1-phosphate uridylyltransferase